MAQSNRFGKVVIQDKEGRELLLEEPVFVLPATDQLAQQAIAHYLNVCKSMGCSDEYVEIIDCDLQDFVDFAAKHPDKVKMPGRVSQPREDPDSSD